MIRLVYFDYVMAAPGYCKHFILRVRHLKVVLTTSHVPTLHCWRQLHVSSDGTGSSSSAHHPQYCKPNAVPLLLMKTFQ